MNERIVELAFEAAGGMLSYDGEGEWRLSQKEAEKFAELIVRECAKVCDDLQKWSSTEPRHCASDIRIHFGVSE